MSEVQQRGDEWPPSIPQLAAALKPRPADYGMPDVDAAWREASSKSGALESARWSHEAVREAGRLTGWFDISTATTQQQVKAAEKRFKTQYQAVVNNVMRTGVVTGSQLLSNAHDISRTKRAEQTGRALAESRVREQGLPEKMSAADAFKAMGL